MVIFVSLNHYFYPQFLGRPKQLSAGLGFTTDSFFFRQLPSDLAEWNSTKTGHVLASDCDLKMHVRNLGYPIPLQISGSKPFFDFTYNITANLTAYIFRMKHDTHNRASTLTTTRGLLHHLKMS